MTKNGESETKAEEIMDQIMIELTLSNGDRERIVIERQDFNFRPIFNEMIGLLVRGCQK